MITGNHFIGGTIYKTVYTGTAISVGATIYSSPGGSGPFPLPEGWTALPNLGTVIENNVDPGFARRNHHRRDARRQLLGRAS